MLNFIRMFLYQQLHNLYDQLKAVIGWLIQYSPLKSKERSCFMQERSFDFKFGE
jgi:hypothetical protein